MGWTTDTLCHPEIAQIRSWVGHTLIDRIPRKLTNSGESSTMAKAKYGVTITYSGNAYHNQKIFLQEIWKPYPILKLCFLNGKISKIMNHCCLCRGSINVQVYLNLYLLIFFNIAILSKWLFEYWWSRNCGALLVLYPCESFFIKRGLTRSQYSCFLLKWIYLYLIQWWSTGTKNKCCIMSSNILSIFLLKEKWTNTQNRKVLFCLAVL